MKNEIDANILTQLKQKKNQTAVESYVENFKERIESIEKKLKEDSILSNQITEENFSLISSPEEEIDFWKILSRSNPQDIRINSIYEQYTKIEKYFLPSYEIVPEKCNEIFTQLIGCVEDINNKIVPKVNPERLKHFLSLSFDYLQYFLMAMIGTLKYRSE